MWSAGHDFVVFHWLQLRGMFLPPEKQRVLAAATLSRLHLPTSSVARLGLRKPAALRTSDTRAATLRAPCSRQSCSAVPQSAVLAHTTAMRAGSRQRVSASPLSCKASCQIARPVLVLTAVLLLVWTASDAAVAAASINVAAKPRTLAYESATGPRYSNGSATASLSARALAPVVLESPTAVAAVFGNARATVTWAYGGAVSSDMFFEVVAVRTPRAAALCCAVRGALLRSLVAHANALCF